MIVYFFLMEKTIGASAFRADCFRLLEQTRTQGTAWTITKHGKLVARVIPVRRQTGTRRGQFKSMGTIVGDIVTCSAANSWGANAR